MNGRLVIATAILAPVLAACGQSPAGAPQVHVAPVQQVVPGVHLHPVIRPCLDEDSAGPCYWNAGARGNGRGRSFLVSASGRVTYVSRGYVAELDRLTFARAVAATPACRRDQVTDCHYADAVSVSWPSGQMFAEIRNGSYRVDVYPR